MLDDKRILVLESDPQAARTAQVRLRTAGFRVLRVKSLEELLERCIENRPHGILVELGDSPKQIRDMLANLRQHQANIPAIVFSIRDEDSLQWDSSEARFVIKPFDPIQLVEQMNEAIAERETRNQPNGCLIPPLSKWTEHVRSMDSDIDVIYSTLTKFIENHAEGTEVELSAEQTMPEQTMPEQTMPEKAMPEQTKSSTPSSSPA